MSGVANLLRPSECRNRSGNFIVDDDSHKSLTGNVRWVYWFTFDEVYYLKSIRQSSRDAEFELSPDETSSEDSQESLPYGLILDTGLCGSDLKFGLRRSVTSYSSCCSFEDWSFRNLLITLLSKALSSRSMLSMSFGRYELSFSLLWRLKRCWLLMRFRLVDWGSRLRYVSFS